MKRVIVIEDEPYLCALVKEILESTGEFDVFFANDGIAGMELCVCEPPDLIILDYILPGSRGDQVAKSLQANQRTAGIPIVLISALSEGLFLDDLEIWEWLSRSPIMNNPDHNVTVPRWESMPPRITEKSGVVAFIPKPFTKETLLEVARRFAARR